MSTRKADLGVGWGSEVTRWEVVPVLWPTRWTATEMGVSLVAAQ